MELKIDLLFLWTVENLFLYFFKCVIYILQKVRKLGSILHVTESFLERHPFGRIEFHLYHPLFAALCCKHTLMVTLGPCLIDNGLVA